jgi:hypothetical protein
MYERVYRALLCLYPRRFRESYGEEALQLFRGRMEDERGWLRRLRLWLDLLLDLGAIRIRGYREATVVGTAAATGQRAGIPSFASLEVRALEARFLVWVLSVVFCGAVLFALQHGGGRLPLVRAMLGSNDPVIRAKQVPEIEFSYEPVDAVEGSVVRLHAVVKAKGDGPVPTGKVNFLHGWDIFVDGKLVDGSVTVVAKVPKGKRLPLNALYTGDMNYGSVSSVENAQ